ncbi:MAG: histidine phosphatase family protein [Gammaproteobacteria bacterium]
MAELYLVRHGQASFGEGEYDALSELGRQQSRWLGEYFAERHIGFDRLFTGTLRRQQETARSIAEGMGLELTLEEHPGLDEYEFGALLEALLSTSGTDQPDLLYSDQKTFYRTLKKALIAWQAGELPGPLPESWHEYARRVGEALRAIQATATKGGRVLVVSSGGPISWMVAKIVQAPERQAIEFNLQLYNTGVSRFFFNAERMVISGFNAIPHLDSPGRLHAVSYG